MPADRSRDEVRGALNAQTGGGGEGGKVSLVTPSDGAGGLDIKRPTHTLLPSVTRVHARTVGVRRTEWGGGCFHLQRRQRTHGAAGDMSRDAR